MKVESLFHIRVEKSDLVEKNQISLDLGPQNQDKSEKSGQLGTLVLIAFLSNNSMLSQPLALLRQPLIHQAPTYGPKLLTCVFNLHISTYFETFVPPMCPRPQQYVAACATRLDWMPQSSSIGVDLRRTFTWFVRWDLIGNDVMQIRWIWKKARQNPLL